MSAEDIAVIGAGSYGTCLAMLFGNARPPRRASTTATPSRPREMERARENAAYLPGHQAARHGDA